jgi:hypothetical protein
MSTTQLPRLVFDNEPVDEGILELVHYLRGLGLPTIASCQGKSPSQPGHAFAMPLVRLDFSGNTDSIPYLKDRVKTLHAAMSKAYKGYTIQTQISWNADGVPTRVLYDVMFVKSVKEEFDITKYRK